jgi:hypothetical protein
MARALPERHSSVYYRGGGGGGGGGRRGAGSSSMMDQDLDAGFPGALCNKAHRCAMQQRKSDGCLLLVILLEAV